MLTQHTVYVEFILSLARDFGVQKAPSYDERFRYALHFGTNQLINSFNDFDQKLYAKIFSRG